MTATDTAIAIITGAALGTFFLAIMVLVLIAP